MTRRSHRVLIPFLLVLASFLFLAGCGDDSDSHEAAVKGTITGFFTDVAENRGTQACDRLATGTVRLLSALAPSAGVPATCPDGIRAVNGRLSDEEKEALKSAEVKTVTISGDTATVNPNDVEFEIEGTSGLLSNVKGGTVQLKKIDDEWKIESLG